MGKNRLKTEDIKPAEYNPRTITEEEAAGLGYSIKSFGDISGITFNQRTQRLVSGHRRWEQLTKEAENGDKREISLEMLDVVDAEDTVSIHRILQGGKPTSFLMRVVDWDEDKEKAANVAANSHTISGKFDLELLSTLLQDMDNDLKELLRMDKLSIDLGLNFSESDWHSDLESVERVEPNNDGITSTIFITCNQDDKESLILYLKGKIIETAFENIEIK